LPKFALPGNNSIVPRRTTPIAPRRTTQFSPTREITYKTFVKIWVDRSGCFPTQRAVIVLLYFCQCFIGYLPCGGKLGCSVGNNRVVSRQHKFLPMFYRLSPLWGEIDNYGPLCRETSRFVNSLGSFEFLCIIPTQVMVIFK
jgi:hypothetical protein